MGVQPSEPPWLGLRLTSGSIFIQSYNMALRLWKRKPKTIEEQI